MGEVRKNLNFLSHKVDAGTKSVVIYESDIIAMLRDVNNRRRAHTSE